MGFGQRFMQQFTNPYDQRGDDGDDYLARLRKRQLEGTGDKVEQTVQNSPNLPWAPGQDSINITRNSTNIGYGGGSLAGRPSAQTPSFTFPGGGTDGGYPYGSMVHYPPDPGGTSVNSTWYPGSYGGGGGTSTEPKTSVNSTIRYGGGGGGEWTEEDWLAYLASMGL